ncbi:TR10B factor, partial [Atlantisia rogersi]|nr:TR10B factor [Atlantisia rogersi]
GTYLEEKNGSRKCLPCKEDEYIEYPNDFAKCLGCRTCREDQVELSPCRAVSNTQCACKNGTFCSPDHPCEMCQKCRPRCPKDEVELAPCTPYSDRQCGPPTSTFYSFPTYMILTIVVVVAVILLMLFCFWKFCCHQSSGKHWVQGTSECSPWLGALCGYRRGGLGTQDNILNERFFQDQLLPRTPGVGTPSAPGSEVRECDPLLHQLSQRPMLSSAFLFPLPLVLRRCFEVFAQEVPHKDWKRYGRALELGENDIAMAEMNDRYSLEPCFQMLTMWQNRQGMNASVNTLLDTLHEINLGGIAEDISFKLVQRGSFQYEVS